MYYMTFQVNRSGGLLRLHWRCTIQAVFYMMINSTVMHNKIQEIRIFFFFLCVWRVQIPSHSTKPACRPIASTIRPHACRLTNGLNLSRLLLAQQAVREDERRWGHGRSAHSEWNGRLTWCLGQRDGNNCRLYQVSLVPCTCMPLKY